MDACIIMAELLYVISSQLTKFIRADKFLLSMPLQHKFANRYMKTLLVHSILVEGYDYRNKISTFTNQ